MSETADPPRAGALDLAGIRRAVDARLAGFLDAKARLAAEEGFPAEFTGVLRDLVLAGGKRIRPELCVVGWYAAAGGRDTEPVLAVAASLEMFHAFALVHDDVMDRSTTRRGQPSAHEALAARHPSHPDAARLGASAAILLGDLALVWSDEMLHTAGLSQDRFGAAAAVVHTMRTELMYGQYLDLFATGQPGTDIDAALRIARLKSAKYTVERPLHLGAALAGADAELFSALSAFALPLGEAFQLRDDLLGVFGDPAVTGKPADDLREGKHTALVALALHRATGSDRELLENLLRGAEPGPGFVARIRDLLESTGARDGIEQLIAARHRQAQLALTAAGLPETASTALRAIASTLTERTS
ncbi:polyprenyl synthetase family protein [Streptomyces sp. NPDC099050]|uniref:polyprenyl synthetase family protein n=1 Tax=Streptomyces sp. NPDC099050 TaxID=3366100 RepID=UPI0038196B79